jgi:hydrogenase-4 membrane subunit HyfE
MKLHSLLLTGALLILSSHSAFAQSVDFVEPKNGAIVASPFCR